MTQTMTTRLLAGTASAILLTMAARGAHATEGYFALGYSPVQQGQGGAGIVDPTDAMSATANPANAAGVGQELSLGLQVFSPRRGFDAEGTFFIPPGSVDSGHDWFAIPNFAYNMPLDNGQVLNFAAYGNGGMNTSYPDGLAGCGSVYCAGGKTGVDLSQLFLSVTWAGKTGGLSWGVAPVLAVQKFSARGFGSFAPFSSDPDNLTNNGADYATGFGLKLGATYEVNEQFSFGIAGQTKIAMSDFEKYAGLFADGGNFDIPAFIGAGIAVRPDPSVTLLLDYQHIFYSDVAAVGNPTDLVMGGARLGDPDGPGFGWEDIDVLKLGAVWRQSDDMTWRAGYAWSGNPVSKEDVTLNIVAPGIVQDHFTFGGTRRLGERDALDFAIVYVPEASLSGPEVTPMGPTPGEITLRMEQFSFALGWTHRF